MTVYYAVKIGKNPGIYNSWEQCSMQVNGYKGAIYKKFSNLRDAEDFINNNSLELELDKDPYKPTLSFSNSPISIAHIYVDGSYSDVTNNYSFGVVVVNDEIKSVIHQFNGVGSNEDAKTIRNVAGELKGTMSAIKWAVTNKFEQVIIYHDYTGINEWATGNWKAKNKFSQQYSKFINDYRDRIKIEFVKVQAHSGNQFNELADSLAKAALEDINSSTSHESDIFTSLKNNTNHFKLLNIKPSKKKSNHFIIDYNDTNYSIKDIHDYSKKIWKSKGNLIKDIKNIQTILNLSSSYISVTISNKINEKEQMQIYIDF